MSTNRSGYIQKPAFNTHYDKQKGKENYIRLFIIPYALGEKNVPWGLLKRVERLAKKYRHDPAYQNLWESTRETLKLVIMQRARAMKRRKAKQQRK